MRESKTEILTGAAVLLLAVGFLIYALQGSGRLARQDATYPLIASFRSAEGVALGVDVRMSGVKVGSVTDMQLNPETFRADTTLSLYQGIEIPIDSTAVVATEGLLGGTFVELYPGGAWDNYQPGDLITETQGSVNIVTLLAKFAGGGGEE